MVANHSFFSESAQSPINKGNYNPDISICIATFRRPERLTRLLESLSRLSIGSAFTVEVIVVDNDAAETARLIVDKTIESFPYPLYYVVEQQQNISHARNRGVQEARGTWVAFIDDDEEASRNWLKAYWQFQLQQPGDGYFGRVIPRLEQDTAPSWMDLNHFFARTRYATGELVPDFKTPTCNAFIRRSWFDQYQFDPRFGLSGGEDGELFRRMRDDGALWYWCDEAVTYEYYPPERVCCRWLLQRAFSGGTVYTRLHKLHHPHFFQQLSAGLRATAGLMLFSVISPFEIFRGRAYVVKRLMRVSTQLGHLWTLLNLKYEEYSQQG